MAGLAAAGANDKKVIEWEEESLEEGSGKLKESCKKLNKNSSHHNHMILVDDVIKMMEKKMCVDQMRQEYPTALTEYDAKILHHYGLNNLEEFKKVTDAVVKICVKKTSGLNCGTGFLIPRPPGYKKGTEKDICIFAVLTNFHNVKQKDTTAMEIDEQLVSSDDIEVRFFYDSEKCSTNDRVVRCRVSEISQLCSMNVSAEGDQSVSDEHLDFAILYIRRPENSSKRVLLNTLRPLQFEETARIQLLVPNGSQQMDSNIRLCIIGHPHGAYKHIAFGGLVSNTNGLWREWDAKNNMHGVEHSVATCPGSSGSPVFMIDVGDGSVASTLCLGFVPFLHFRGNWETGDAVSMQSVLPKIRELVSLKVSEVHVPPQRV